jgi:hypothetical protein
MRMSHEGERVTGARIRERPDRALPHWLNPLVGLRENDLGSWGSGRSALIFLWSCSVARMINQPVRGL